MRRVNSAGPDGRIAGTTLDVSDLRLISQLLGASSISRDRATRWHDRAAQVLRFSPTVADSPYRRVLATVDEQTCVVVRAEFQDAQDPPAGCTTKLGCCRHCPSLPDNNILTPALPNPLPAWRLPLVVPSKRGPSRRSFSSTNDLTAKRLRP